MINAIYLSETDGEIIIEQIKDYKAYERFCEKMNNCIEEVKFVDGFVVSRNLVNRAFKASKRIAFKEAVKKKFRMGD